MLTLPKPLRPLAEYHQFLLYDRTNKIPIDYRTGRPYVKGSDWQNDPAATGRFSTVAAMSSDRVGVGFLIRNDDPFFFLDIDNCLNGSGWNQTALDIMGRLPGAAVEISQSGKGLHIFGKYQGEALPHGCKNRDHGIELYTGGRFAALTGHNAVGSADQDCTPVLPGVVGLYFPPSSGGAAAGEWTTEAVTEWTGTNDDAALIKKALAAAGTAGLSSNRATFKELWERDVDALSASFPDKYGGGRPYDESDADAALAFRLAFWTGKNCERILRLMKQSALVREKWDRDDYLQRTILGACSRQETVYNSGKKKEEPPKPLEPSEWNFERAKKDPIFTGGDQYLNALGQAELFEGCVYIQESHRVFTPIGSLLKESQFNATYGGYTFEISQSGKSTRKAFDAFTESQCVRFPKAEISCFRPQNEPGELIEQEGITAVNVYVPVNVRRVKGNPGPFLSHLAKVLPDERDRAILLSFMAACVQHKGVKFQWAPLIQGAPGNGKSLFSRCLAEAVGKKYTHMPRASEIDEKFNAWLFDKLFIGVEDIKVTSHRTEVLEILKPMITESDQAKRAMREDQIMKETCCNFIFNSNHKDAVQKTKDDRRFAVFYSAQQTSEDLKRDGMDGDYFPDLYDWLKSDGYAIVAEYLHTYPIPCEFNPAKSCHRAPETSSTEAALYESLGPVEHEIMEAVEEGRPGFSGGFISSICLDRLLKEKRKDNLIPVHKRAEMLKGIGYVRHPALTKGRVNVVVMPDAGRPVLFVRPESEQAAITEPAVVARVYQEGQTILPA